MDFIRWLVSKESRAANRPPSLNHSLLLDLARGHSQKISGLDPAVSPGAAHRFQSLTRSFWSDDSKVRFGHSSISDRFTDGGLISSLASDLTLGIVDPAQVPPLVAVKYKGCYFVVMGNRRLWAFQNCGRPIQFNMVVHEWNQLDGMSSEERFAFIAKTFRAATSTTAGKHVEVRPSRQTDAASRLPKPSAAAGANCNALEEPLGLQPCPKPRPAKKAMPRPAKKARPQPAPSQKAMPRPIGAKIC